MATVVGAQGYSSAQPNGYDPALTLPHPIRVWGTSGNTDTCYDTAVTPRSLILVNPTTTGGEAPQGFWQVVPNNGYFTVTSTDSESAGLTYNYRVL